MEARTLHRRLIAVTAGIAVAALAVLATHVLLPPEDAHDPTVDYGYVYSGAKSSSAAFVRANLTDDSILVLGSSEFSTPAKTVPQVPANTFGTSNYGLHMMLVGEAFDQCLWHTVAIGALADGGLPKNKVVLVVGLGQYTDGGLDASTFSSRFSYALYRDFCANERIDADLRERVRARLAEQGVDETTLRAAAPANPLDAIDGLVLSDMNALKVRNDLGSVRASGVAYADGAAQRPNWARLRDEALSTARTMSTTNEWGVEDAFYTRQLAPALPSLSGARADETYQNTPEYDDLDLFLSVCDACGIQPLIVVEPVLGPYYDYIGIRPQTREAAYERIRSVVNGHKSARLADFSDKEYEKYFLFDIVHFGWTGWIDAEQAIYEFAMGEGAYGTQA